MSVMNKLVDIAKSQIDIYKAAIKKYAPSVDTDELRFRNQLIPFPYADSFTNKNGVNIDILDDGRIHFYGTATGDVWFNLISESNMVTLPIGDYYAHINIEGTGVGIVSIRVSGLSDIRSSTAFTVENKPASMRSWIGIYSGTTVDAVVELMVSPGSDPKPYEPYNLLESIKSKISHTSVENKLSVIKQNLEKIYDAAVRKFATIKSASGSGVIAITDSADYKPLDLKLYGKSEQKQYEGYQLFDISKLDIITDHDSGQGNIIEIGENYFVVNTTSEHKSNGYTNTGKTLKELCPDLKVGYMYHLYGTTPSAQKTIYCNKDWYMGRSIFIKDYYLTSNVIVYGYRGNEGYGDCRVSDLLIRQVNLNDLSDDFVTIGGTTDNTQVSCEIIDELITITLDLAQGVTIMFKNTKLEVGKTYHVNIYTEDEKLVGEKDNSTSWAVFFRENMSNTITITYDMLSSNYYGMYYLQAAHPGVKVGTFKYRIVLSEDESSVNTAWEPYVGGEPSPNMKYPQQIVSVGQKLYSGTNLFDAKTALASQIEAGLCEVNDDGSVTLHGTFNGSNRTFSVPLKAGTYYFKEDTTAFHQLTNGDAFWQNRIVLTEDTEVPCYISYIYDITKSPVTTYPRITREEGMSLEPFTEEQEILVDNGKVNCELLAGNLLNPNVYKVDSGYITLPFTIEDAGFRWLNTGILVTKGEVLYDGYCIDGVFTTNYTHFYNIGYQSSSNGCLQTKDGTITCDRDGLLLLRLDAPKGSVVDKPYLGYVPPGKMDNLFDSKKANNVSNWIDSSVVPNSKAFPIYVGTGNKVYFSYKQTLTTGLGFYAYLSLTNEQRDYYIYHSSNGSFINNNISFTATEDYIYLIAYESEIPLFMQYIGNDLVMKIVDGDMPPKYEPYIEQPFTALTPSIFTINPNAKELYEGLVYLTYDFRAGKTYTLSFDTPNTGYECYIHDKFAWYPFKANGQRVSVTKTFTEDITFANNGLVCLYQNSNEYAGRVTNITLECIDGNNKFIVSSHTGLKGLNDTKDYVDFESFKLVQKLIRFKLSTNMLYTSWTYKTSTNQGNHLFQLNIASYGKASTVWTDVIGVRSTHFICTSKTNDDIINHPTVFIWGNEITFAFPPTSEMNSLELFEEFITNNDVYVEYVLAEPIVKDLTEEEIAQYKALRINSPQTTILNDGNAEMELNYVVDPG